MEEKSVKELFESLRAAQQLVEADIRRLATMRRQLEGGGAVDYSKSIIHGGTPQTLGDSVIYLVSFEDRLKEDVAKRNEIIQQVLMIIDGVEDEKLKLILTLRYREFLRWEIIAKRIGYTKRQTIRLNKRALQAAEAVKREIFRKD